MIEAALEVAAEASVIACAIAGVRAVARLVRRWYCGRVGHRWALILEGAHEAQVMAAEGITFTRDDPLQVTVVPRAGARLTTRFTCLRCGTRPADLIL